MEDFENEDDDQGLEETTIEVVEDDDNEGLEGQAPVSSEDEQPEQKDEQAPEVVPISQFNALAAKHRVSERNMELLQRRTDLILQRLVAIQPDQPEHKTEELPDPELEPEKHLIARMARMEEQRAIELQLQEQQRQQEMVGRAYSEVMNHVANYRSQSPDEYDAATLYLANLHMEEAREEYPNSTDDELGQELTRRIQQTMFKWAQQGKNPGEQIMTMARRRGFNFAKPASKSPDAPVQRKVAGPQREGRYGKASTAPGGGGDARATIQAQQAKQSRSRTISTIGSSGGGAGRKVTTKQLLGMDEDEFEKTVNGMTFQDLLKHKARQ